MSIHKKLQAIQQELNAPKNQRNNFWNYNYRSAEDILEAVKPLLKAHDCVLTLNDEITNVWERYYIRAGATLSLIEKDNSHDFCTTAYWIAREEEVKKGMSWDQITWACSSYARKYALNGLFLIDDNKDSDHTNTHWEATKASAPTSNNLWNCAKCNAPNTTYQKSWKVGCSKLCWK